MVHTMHLGSYNTLVSDRQVRKKVWENWGCRSIYAIHLLLSEYLNDVRAIAVNFQHPLSLRIILQCAVPFDLGLRSVVPRA